MPQLVPSRFNSWVWDGADRLLVSNSFSSALLEFTGATAPKVARVLDGSKQNGQWRLDPGDCDGQPTDCLATNWVLVPHDYDEMDLAHRIHEAPFRMKDRLGLTLVSRENCNFRCVYCCDTFEKQRMLPEVAEGVVALVRKRAATLSSLNVSWFGGEPLLAYDLLASLSTRLREICEGASVSDGSSMTTNGSFYFLPLTDTPATSVTRAKLRRAHRKAMAALLRQADRGWPEIPPRDWAAASSRIRLAVPTLSCRRQEPTVLPAATSSPELEAICVAREMLADLRSGAPVVSTAVAAGEPGGLWRNLLSLCENLAPRHALE